MYHISHGIGRATPSWHIAGYTTPPKAKLETKCIGLEVEIKNQYDRINAMKLDKSVFEATMMQLNTVQNDLHEIRADIRELLKCQGTHK